MDVILKFLQKKRLDIVLCIIFHFLSRDLTLKLVKSKKMNKYLVKMQKIFSQIDQLLL